jgi:hypothetical protein
MEKIDYKKEYKELYGGKVGEIVVVTVPKMSFLMVDGHGDPNTSQEYIDAVQALYPVAYTLKFMCKKELGKDYTVLPLEGLWWAEDMGAFMNGKKDDWSWRMMIMQLDFITRDMVEQAIKLVEAKKKPVSLHKVRFESYDEGRAAQVMYLGGYSDEGPTILKLHEYIQEQGGALEKTNKYHHEIYLGDPRRTDPAKLKTVIRQPF